MVHRCLLGSQTFLLGELLVEAEHGALPLSFAHVACATAARGEKGIIWWGSELDARGWARGGCAVGDFGRLDTDVVAGATTAGVHDVGWADGWVRLGNVERDHCDVCCGCCGCLTKVVGKVGRAKSSGDSNNRQVDLG